MFFPRKLSIFRLNRRKKAFFSLNLEKLTKNWFSKKVKKLFKNVKLPMIFQVLGVSFLSAPYVLRGQKMRCNFEIFSTGTSRSDPHVKRIPRSAISLKIFPGCHSTFSKNTRPNFFIQDPTTKLSFVKELYFEKSVVSCPASQFP